MKDHGKQLVESIEIIKKDFDINRDSIPLEEKKKNLINLLKKDLVNLQKLIWIKSTKLKEEVPKIFVFIKIL